jgi:hypothetical protein
MHQSDRYDGPLTPAELAQHNAHLAGTIYRFQNVTPCRPVPMWRKALRPLVLAFVGVLFGVVMLLGLPYLAASDWFSK